MGGSRRADYRQRFKCRHRSKRETRSDKHCPGLLGLGRHRHRRELCLVTHLREKDDPECR